MNPDFVLVQRGFIYQLEGDRYVTRARRGRLLPGAPNPAQVIECWLTAENVYFYPPTGPDFERASDYGDWLWLHKDKVPVWADRLDATQVEYTRKSK